MNSIQPDAPYPVPRDDKSGYGGDPEEVEEYEPELIESLYAEPEMETEE